MGDNIMNDFQYKKLLDKLERLERRVIKLEKNTQE